MPPSSAISAACCRCTRPSRLRWVSRLFVCLIWFARPFQRGKRNDSTRITEKTQSSLSRRLLDVEFVIVPCSSFRLQKKAKLNLAFIFDQRNILCSCSFLAFSFSFLDLHIFITLRSKLIICHLPLSHTRHLNSSNSQTLHEYLVLSIFFTFILPFAPRSVINNYDP